MVVERKVACSYFGGGRWPGKCESDMKERC